jgi:ankyrin repeat protein
MSNGAVERAYRGDIGYYEERADGLYASARDGTESTLARFARWGAPLTPEGARVVLARQHGFGTWEELRRYVGALNERGDQFALAFRAIEAQDPNALRDLLDGNPGLVKQVGTNGNDLLGFAAAKCDERLVRLLLERGAAPGHGNAHNWTALHQAAYNGLPILAEMLIAAGAPIAAAARGIGGTPLIVALFWGKRDVAHRLAEESLVPGNLRVAAGLGRLELLEKLAPSPGLVVSAAGAQRGFYRPHSGFPAWRPADDPQEVLDEALTWAARNDRADAIRALAACGASLDTDVYRGTALAWAASRGHVNSLCALLALGADPNAPTTFGGPDHGERATALHLAAESNHVDVIRLLLDAGADPTIHDARHDHTPAGWAKHGGQAAAFAVLRDRGG